MEEFALLCLVKKKNFVSDLGNALAGPDRIRGIRGLRYEAYENEDENVQEYVIIEFVGGAESPLTVNCDSHSEIIRDLANKIDGGYYNEVKDYEDLKKNPKWKKVI